MELIEELKEEHREINNLFIEIKKHGVYTMEGRNILCSAEAKLLDHLKKEDTQLYTFLNDHKDKNRDLMKTIDAFKDEMSAITSFALKFFRKYSIEGGGIDFLSDFNKLYTSFNIRIANEENILFNAYSELKNKLKN